MIDLITTEEILTPGNLSVVAGRPAMGKTCFAVDFAFIAAEMGKRIMFFSSECEKKSVLERFEERGGCPEGLTVISKFCTDLEAQLGSIENTDLVIIDYYQLYCSEKENRLVKRIKKIAASRGFAVILISQLARTVEQRKNHQPRLSDLPQKALIDFSDTILLLYRSAYYDFTAPREEAKIIVAKHHPFIIESSWSDKTHSWGL